VSIRLDKRTLSGLPMPLPLAPGSSDMRMPFFGGTYAAGSSLGGTSSSCTISVSWVLVRYGAFCWGRRRLLSIKQAIIDTSRRATTPATVPPMMTPVLFAWCAGVGGGGTLEVVGEDFGAATSPISKVVEWMHPGVMSTTYRTELILLDYSNRLCCHCGKCN
jgi:hypothetical protein